jgi:hypothetical protein
MPKVIALGFFVSGQLNRDEVCKLVRDVTIATFIKNMFGNGPLCTHGVYGNDLTLQIQKV